uniref:Uncharacterized protein n=1 Tax=Anopheles farauti TaxID=69004 RepID=A0A182QEC7_9DIPT
MKNTLHSKIREAFNDFRGLLLSVVQSESEVFQEFGKDLGGGKNDIGWNVADSRSEDVASVPESTVYVTQMPAASDKTDVNDYDLEPEEAEAITKEAPTTEEAIDVRLQGEDNLEFLPNGSDVKYELSVGPDLLSQERDSEEDEINDDDDDETEVIVLTEDENFAKNLAANGEGSGPAAVLVKDPELAALIPHIIEQLRLENVTSEERATLAEIFDNLWPLMVTEAERLRDTSSA